jgi:hypothetical protein
MGEEQVIYILSLESQKNIQCCVYVNALIVLARCEGICQNPYECRLLEGSPKGQCALGFGVCCVCEYTSVLYY